MNTPSREPSSAAASRSLACEKCGKAGTLAVEPARLSQNATCSECGAGHVLVRRDRWTLVRPDGAVLSFESAKALRRALEDPDTEDRKKVEDHGRVSDDLDLVSISEPPPRLAPIPPVPTADASNALQPPPPPRRSSAPTMPIASSDNASSVTMVVPMPSPLPLPSEASMPPRTDTIQGLGAPPPSEEEPISLRDGFERGNEDDLIEDVPASDEATASDEAPASDEATASDEAPASDEATASDEAPASDEAAASDEAPRSEEAFPLTRIAGAADRSSEPALEPLTTSTTMMRSSSILEDTVNRRRWSDDDEAALAVVPRPRRGGWVVAAGLVAAAAGLVVYLRDTSPNGAARPATTYVAAAPTTTNGSPATADETPATTTSGPAPSTLVVVPEPSAPALGPSLALIGNTPVSVTTTTNATSLAGTTGLAAASSPLVTQRTAAEPVSEDMLPIGDLLRRAHASLSEGDRHRAQQRFRLALAKDPENVEATTGLADIARAEGDIDTARERYQRALERSPSFLPALLALADLEWDRGKRAEAHKRYAAIVDKLGERAPARAVERKGDDSPSPDDSKLVE